jgi:hypothetical protein
MEDETAQECAKITWPVWLYGWGMPSSGSKRCIRMLWRTWGPCAWGFEHQITSINTIIDDALFMISRGADAPDDQASSIEVCCSS